MKFLNEIVIVIDVDDTEGFPSPYKNLPTNFDRESEEWKALLKSVKRAPWLDEPRFSTSYLNDKKKWIDLFSEATWIHHVTGRFECNKQITIEWLESVDLWKPNKSDVTCVGFTNKTEYLLKKIIEMINLIERYPNSLIYVIEDSREILDCINLIIGDRLVKLQYLTIQNASNVNQNEYIVPQIQYIHIKNGLINDNFVSTTEIRPLINPREIDNEIAKYIIFRINQMKKWLDCRKLKSNPENYYRFILPIQQRLGEIGDISNEVINMMELMKKKLE